MCLQIKSACDCIMASGAGGQSDPLAKLANRRDFGEEDTSLSSIDEEGTLPPLASVTHDGDWHLLHRLSLWDIRDPLID